MRRSPDGAALNFGLRAGAAATSATVRLEESSSISIDSSRPPSYPCRLAGALSFTPPEQSYFLPLQSFGSSFRCRSASTLRIFLAAVIITS